MTEQQKEELYFLVNENPNIEPDAVPELVSQVSRIIDDQLKIDYVKEYRKYSSLGYCKDYMNTGRETAFRLTIVSTTLAEMDGAEEGILGEYTYYDELLIDRDIETMQELLESFVDF